MQNVVNVTRLPRAAEKPDEDRVITPEEWAQLRLQLSGEGTLLLCDLALDYGLRFEEVIALRPMDVLEADARNASHVWIRQAVTWPGRAYSGGDEPWLVGPTKGKRFRKVAVSGPVFDRLRLYIAAHGRHIIRAGVMSSDTLRRTAADSFEDFDANLVSVEAVVDGSSVTDTCRDSPASVTAIARSGCPPPADFDRQVWCCWPRLTDRTSTASSPIHRSTTCSAW